MKVIEIALITFVTTTFAYWLPYFVNSECYPSSSSDDKSLVQYNCPSGYFNPLATLLLNTEGLVIKQITGGYVPELSGATIMNSEIMGVFGLFWFFFGFITYGAAIPSGIFLSAILVGCSVG